MIGPKTVSLVALDGVAFFPTASVDSKNGGICECCEDTPDESSVDHKQR
jgi:hypothetical protein